MIYEIINPSDPYTISCPDFQVAAVAVAVLGRGHYGIEGSPILFGWDDWFKQQKIDLPQFLKDHNDEIAAALETVLIGTVKDRELVDRTIAVLPAHEIIPWLDEWHDTRRSSMNDIGANAKKLAANFRIRSASLKEPA